MLALKFSDLAIRKVCIGPTPFLDLYHVIVLAGDMTVMPQAIGGEGGVSSYRSPVALIPALRSFADDTSMQSMILISKKRLFLGLPEGNPKNH